jgi:hypothetical protein
MVKYYREDFPIQQMSQCLVVSPAAYYGWRGRTLNKRFQAGQTLLERTSYSGTLRTFNISGDNIGTDTQGRAHSIVVTDASVHDSQIMDDLIHGEESVVYGDKAYASRDKQSDYEANGITWRINRKANRRRKLNAADKSFNRKNNRTRARVEHLFRIVNDLWGYAKVRYKGLEKNAAQAFTLFALANLYMVRRQLLLPGG